MRAAVLKGHQFERGHSAAPAPDDTITHMPILMRSQYAAGRSVQREEATRSPVSWFPAACRTAAEGGGAKTRSRRCRDRVYSASACWLPPSMRSPRNRTACGIMERIIHPARARYASQRSSTACRRGSGGPGHPARPRAAGQQQQQQQTPAGARASGTHLQQRARGEEARYDVRSVSCGSQHGDAGVAVRRRGAGGALRRSRPAARERGEQPHRELLRCGARQRGAPGGTRALASLGGAPRTRVTWWLPRNAAAHRPSRAIISRQSFAAKRNQRVEFVVLETRQ